MKIKGKMILLFVLAILNLPLAESRTARRGCEEEFSPKLKTEKKMQNSTYAKEEQGDLLTFTLLHVNDIHSHFEEVNVNTGTCKGKSKASGNCYGGVSRMASYIQRVREKDPEALLLNAGDYYQGTMWYTFFKYRPVIQNYTVMALGNHDFDDGTSGLQPFVNQVNYPVLAANVQSSQLVGVEASTVVNVKGRKVGIIGYVTEDTPQKSQPGSETKFLPIIQSIRSEAQRLKQEGVDILIALGHAGYREVDLKMAGEIEELDLVVGGHSHTFLYSSPPPSVEKPEGPYPTYVEQDGGRVVPVVQAYCFSKYIGHLELQFTSNGELVTPVKFAEPALLDSSIPQLPWVERLLEPYRTLLAPYTKNVGFSKTKLTKCDACESNLGNLVTDSMSAAWPNTRIAFINDGGLRTPLEAGEITGEDVFGVLPFNNTVDQIMLSGKAIRWSV